jgi:hypothetical protein
MADNQPAAAEWPDYRITAKGMGANPENRIHSDEVARSLGFAGGLVGGTTVYAYMTHPLVERFGEEWLARGTAELNLYKPAYSGDLLTIRSGEIPAGEEEGGVVVKAFNEQGAELARLESRSPRELPPPHHLAETTAPQKPAGVEKPLVSWEGIVLEEPFWALPWTPDEAENREWSEGVSDELPLYQGGAGTPLHPGLVLQGANNVFKEQFLLPAWIHVSSRITFRDVLRVGQEIEVRAVPTAKYEKKRHHFVDLYVTMLVEGKPAVEVDHQAIFKVHAAA